MLLDPKTRCLICEDDQPAMPGPCNTCGFWPDEDEDAALLQRVGLRIYERQTTQAVDAAYDRENS